MAARTLSVRLDGSAFEALAAEVQQLLEHLPEGALHRLQGEFPDLFDLSVDLARTETVAAFGADGAIDLRVLPSLRLELFAAALRAAEVDRA